MTEIEAQSLEATHLGFLDRLTINKILRPDDGSECDLELVLRLQNKAVTKRVVVKCKGVRSLYLGDLVATTKLQLAVYDISERGLEAQRFRVVDEEERMIAFNCADLGVSDID